MHGCAFVTIDLLNLNKSVPEYCQKLQGATEGDQRKARHAQAVAGGEEADARLDR
jgi:hypothetical protein